MALWNGIEGSGSMHNGDVTHGGWSPLWVSSPPLGKGSTMGMESILGMDETVGMNSNAGYMVMISEVENLTSMGTPYLW